MGHKLRFRCDVGWANMAPLPDGGRHCGRCDRPVHDITGFTLREAEQFRRENRGACVRVLTRVDTEELVFAPEPRRRLPVREAAIAAALAMGCSTAPPAVEAPSGEAVVETARESFSAAPAVVEVPHPAVDVPAEGGPPAPPRDVPPAPSDLAPEVARTEPQRSVPARPRVHRDRRTPSDAGPTVSEPQSAPVRGLIRATNGIF